MQTRILEFNARFQGSEIGSLEVQGVSVIYDIKEIDPAKRYKMIISQLVDYYGDTYGIFAAFSADGINWTRNTAFVLHGDRAETQHLLNAPDFSQYMITHKVVVLAGDNPGSLPDRRARAVALSSNFLDYSSSVLILQPDANDQPNTELYDGTAFAYGHVYLGFLRVLHYKGDFRDNDLQLSYSRDALNWSRIDDRDFYLLTPSKDQTDWDYGNIMAFDNAPILVGDEMRIYYKGSKARKGQTPLPEPYSFIGLATMRSDGFVSLVAEDMEAILETTNVVFSNDQHLYVNADVKGYIHAQLTDKEGLVILGYERENSIVPVADGVSLPIKWVNHMKLPNGQETYKLQLFMKDAKIYSLKTSSRQIDWPEDCADIFNSSQRLKGDINGDCMVDLIDLSILAKSWIFD